MHMEELACLLGTIFCLSRCTTHTLTIWGLVGVALYQEITARGNMPGCRCYRVPTNWCYRAPTTWLFWTICFLPWLLPKDYTLVVASCFVAILTASTSHVSPRSLSSSNLWTRRNDVNQSILDLVITNLAHLYDEDSVQILPPFGRSDRNVVVLRPKAQSLRGFQHEGCGSTRYTLKAEGWTRALPLFRQLVSCWLR